MSEPPDFNTLKILYDHGIPRKITLDVDKEELRKDLIDSGLDKRFVQNLIKVLGAGMTLDMDWEFLEDYDREEVQSRITRRTMLKPEVVSDVLDLIYSLYDIRTTQSFNEFQFEEKDGGLSVLCHSEKIVTIDVPSMVSFNDKLYKVIHFRGIEGNHDSIIKVNLPDSILEIEKFAFSGCKSLSSIEIPESVTEIGNDAFSYCTSLSSITIPSSVTKNNEFTFTYCESLLSIVIPNSVTTIETEAFGVCSSLSSVTIPNSVTKIGSAAFEGCESLSSIEIPESVTEIGDYPFVHCISLKSIEVSPSNQFYESSDGVLYTKGKKAIICFPAGKQSSECDVLYHTSSDQQKLISFIVPDSVESIYEDAFRKCTSLSSIEIPNSVKEIGSRAFAGCTSLSSIIISDSVEKIGTSAFRDCESLHSIKIPSSLKEINNSVFENCISLSSIEIPNSVTKIDKNAFWYCKSLSSIFIPDSVKEIDECAFTFCISLTSIEISPDNQFYEFSERTLYTKGKKTLVRYFYEKQLAKGKTSESSSDWTFPTTIIIPDSVESIGNYAFRNCESLESIVIPSSVEKIGWNAFEGCRSLKSINIPDSVKDIGYHTFEGCKSLNDESVKQILKVDPNAIF